MARPYKEGLDYFPLDVDMAGDDKVLFIESQHGVAGFGILVRLLMEIYKNGYYCTRTEYDSSAYIPGQSIYTRKYSSTGRTSIPSPSKYTRG